MGLVESSQNRSFPWGPAKSRSTHQFFGSRNYDGRAQKAATLPGRTRVIEDPLQTGSRTPGSSETFGCLDLNDSSEEQTQLNGPNGPDPNDKGSVINKRISDPLTGYFADVCNGSECNNRVMLMDESSNKNLNSYSHESLCAKEDVATEIYGKPYFRTSVSFPYKKCSSDYEVGVVMSEEKETQTSPPSTLDKTSLNRSTSEMVRKCQNRSGRRKSRGRISTKLSTSVPAPRSEPYLSLHYDEPLASDEYAEVAKNSLSRASLYINGDKSVIIPTNEKSQLFIKCNVPVQVSPNVWFESNIVQGKRKTFGFLRKQSSDSNLANTMQTTVVGQQNKHITQLPSIFIKQKKNKISERNSKPSQQSNESSVNKSHFGIVDCDDKCHAVNIPSAFQRAAGICSSVGNIRRDYSPDGNQPVPLHISQDEIPRMISPANKQVEIASKQPDGINLAPIVDHISEDKCHLYVASHLTEVDTFPELRLPRPEGQANLVDILASANLADGTLRDYDVKRSTTLPNSFKRNKIIEADASSFFERQSPIDTFDKKGHHECGFGVANFGVSMTEDVGLDPVECICHNGHYSDISSQCFHNNYDNSQNNSVNNSQEMRSYGKLHVGKDCGFTCHEQCQNVVSLDCKTTLSEVTTDDLEDTETEAEPVTGGTPTKIDDVTDDEIEAEEKHEDEIQEKDLGYCELIENEQMSTLRRTVCRIQSQMVASSEIEEWVEKYSSANQGLQIAKEKDGSYRGCLRIHLNLSRPINIVAGTRPPSIYDILQEDRTMEKTLTSFYMPRDAVKAIHITSKTTTREVIIALLKKFKVVDNPQKFALYEKTYDVMQSMKAKLNRLGDGECPLVLAIAWGAQSLSNKRLVLQENDTADIQWDAFSLPELFNFLRILDKEENEYKNQIRDKYCLLHKRINDHINLGNS